MVRRVLALALATAVSADFSEPPEPCDPLVPEYCSFPWPNDYWLLKDLSSNGVVTPQKLMLTEQNSPVDRSGHLINLPLLFDGIDGFAPVPSILAYFPNLDISNCPPLWDVAQSMDQNSPTILMDSDTGEIIPHWVELDHISDDPVLGREANRSMMIWPAIRLTDGHRYIVAMRSLQTSRGRSVQMTQQWLDLRNGNAASTDTYVQFRLQYYQEYIFAPLKKYRPDVTIEDLQLAWDFTVMSTETMTEQMIQMRDDATTRVMQNGGNLGYRISDIHDDFTPQVTARVVHGWFNVPWYLTEILPIASSRLVTQYDDINEPVFQHMAEVRFEMSIPYSLANGSISEGILLQYGHGLFGSYKEIEQDYLQNQSVNLGFVLFGCDWLGMASEDIEAVTQIVGTNLSDFKYTPDRLHQGMLDALLLMKLMMSEDFQADERIWKFDGSFGGPSDGVMVTVNQEDRHYYGNSLGGIMGSVYMSLTQDVTIGSIGVPGFPFELLLPRSTDFTIFEDMLKVRYTSDLGRCHLFGIIGLPWVRLEPAGYISHLNGQNPLKDTPAHAVLVHYGLGDAQVTWLGGELLGRSIGAKMYQSNVAEGNETLYGFDFISDDTVYNDVSSDNPISLIQGWGYDVPQVPFVNRPPQDGYDTHSYTRRQASAIEANHIFWLQKSIKNVCGGPCEGYPTEKHPEEEFLSRSLEERLGHPVRIN